MSESTWLGSGARPAHATLEIGPDMPYAVFVVRGVTYSFSAPTVTPFDDMPEWIDPDTLPTFDSPSNIADVGTETVDASPATPAPARSRKPSLVEFAYAVFTALGERGRSWAQSSGWLPLTFDTPSNIADVARHTCFTPAPCSS